MIAGWFFGDIAKTIFYFYKDLPLFFKCGGCFAVTVDTIIMLQYFIYPQIELDESEKTYYSGEITKEGKENAKTAVL